jgi:hypothetical protein
MDDTEEYINMSKSSLEIQALKPLIGGKLESGCYFYEDIDNIGDYVSIAYICQQDLFYSELPESDNYVWLPRQDQLQKILANYYSEQDGMVYSSHYIKVAFIDFKAWLDKQYLNKPFVCVPTNCFDSGEKLWLAFVMKQKYNKEWRNDSWQNCV